MVEICQVTLKIGTVIREGYIFYKKTQTNTPILFGERKNHAFKARKIVRFSVLIPRNQSFHASKSNIAAETTKTSQFSCTWSTSSASTYCFHALTA